ncbi:VgrG-related protein [Desmonostoc muscorum LEGE 12446]|uniref:VgrG-related protein n=1 Tax=Desmonostoc muscorum LEGE 12446 TaxID=1828758 RepID=A0A8J7DHJ3_DESMC|nr:VgrG-related protein [Desmonostoc muscorum]MCF2149258.1 VgrG-related protein [Desmonostoc muscorum LEGE 12446]
MTNESLYLSDPLVQIEGNPASPELLKDLLQITVEESLHLPAMFTLVIHNSYIPTSNRPENQPWRHQELFKIGNKVTLGFKSSTTQDQNFRTDKRNVLIEGEITGMEVHFNEKSEANMIVRGYDISHRLHRGRYNRSFLNITDSQIVKKIVKEVGIDIGKIDESGEVHKYVFQENQTNMEFLQERAARIGFDLFVTEDNINFCKPESQASLPLKWLVEISKFSTRVTSAEQVSSVEVRGWDYTKKQLISSTANKEKQITKTGNQLGSSTSNKFRNLQAPKMIVVDKPVATQKQADVMAQALCDELGGEFVFADAKAFGNPEIRPRRVVRLQELGTRYNGEYYVTETRHFYNGRVYETDFSVRGLRAANLFTTLSTKKHLQPSETLLVGIVTDNKDPEKWGRVKVKFPTLTEEHASDWARVVAVGAGPNRGFDCLPEINDEVLVGFEHGDIHRPYVIGGVWNGKDAPPEKVDDSVGSKGVRLRTIKTRVGHVLQFVEEDKASSKTGIRTETQAGHKMYLNDSDRHIEIKTAGGHTIKMDDGRKSITIETTGGHSIEMSDASKSVSVKSKGNLSLDAVGNIDITANGNITVRGAIIRLN